MARKREKLTSIRELIRQMRLMDNIFMDRVFDGNISGTEYVLRIILDDPGLKVESVSSEQQITNLTGRTVRLDIFARDASGRPINIEIQRDNAGTGHRRARYYSSLIDSNEDVAEDDYSDLTESYVIFITEDDTFKDGKPLHHIERTDQETGADFNDGQHIIYVNGKYNGDDPVGHLMNDFRVSDPEEMYSEELARTVRRIKGKEQEEATQKMSSVLDEFKEECIEYGKEEGKAAGIAEGKAAGIAEGKAAGIAESRSIMSLLLSKMEKDGRTNDYLRAMKDSAYLDECLKEYGLA